MVVATVWSTALLCPPIPSQAQNALGDGRALDANMQAGSGGTNPNAPTRDFSAGNNLVTGNVAGLGYFRDEVGYTAPGEFRDPIGDDDLFRFRAHSLMSSPSMASQRNYSVSRNSGVNQENSLSVYRSLSGISSQDVQINSTRSKSLAPNNATRSFEGASGLVIKPSVTNTATPSFTGTTAIRSDQRRIGFIAQPDGKLLELSASPLLGMRRREIESRRVELVTEEQETNTVDHTTNTLPQQNEIGTTTPLGKRILNEIEQYQLGRTTPASSQRIGAIKDSLFRPLDTTSAQKPGQEPYLDILNAIQGNWHKTVQTDQNARLNENNYRNTSRSQGLIPPSEFQLKKARDAWMNTQRSIEALATENTPDPNNPAQTLLEKLDFDLPPVATLAATQDERIAALTTQAQQDLQDGRYMNARELYRQILLLNPDTPMAMVGLTHAQLGAGMIRSAQLRLHSLFVRHPEMIAVRYQAHLLPNPQRLQWTSDELMKMIELGDNSVEASILLGYLGYQTNSLKLVQYALDIAAAQDPNNPIILIARRAWLGEDAHGRLSNPDGFEPDFEPGFDTLRR